MREGVVARVLTRRWGNGHAAEDSRLYNGMKGRKGVVACVLTRKWGDGIAAEDSRLYTKAVIRTSDRRLTFFEKF
jgi:hypothetical protein